MEPTTVTMNYMRARTGDNVVEFRSWQDIKSLMSVKGNQCKGTASQTMKANSMSKILMDLDDKADTREEAEQIQAKLMLWATQTLPELLGYSPEQARDEQLLAISQRTVSQEWTSEMITISHTDEQGQETGKAKNKQRKWFCTGKWKASLHIVLTQKKIRWDQQYRWLTEKGIVSASPDSHQKPGTKVIDDSLYTMNASGTRQIVMLGNAKPGPWGAEYCMDPNTSAPNEMNNFNGTDGRIKQALEGYCDHSRYRYHHLLTTALDKCELVSVELASGELSPPPATQTSNSMSPAETSAATQRILASLTRTQSEGVTSSELFDVGDIMFMLRHTNDPPHDRPRNDWRAVACFLKRRCAHLENFNPYETWCQWSIGFDRELSTMTAIEKAELEREWDGVGKLDTVGFGRLCKMARFRSPVDVSEYAAKSDGYLERYDMPSEAKKILFC